MSKFHAFLSSTDVPSSSKYISNMDFRYIFRGYTKRIGFDTDGWNSKGGYKKTVSSTVRAMMTQKTNSLVRSLSESSQSIDRKSITLVRHGQSTWNEQGRIQGSSNISVLTELGESQALKAGEYLKEDRFEYCLRSPLKRAQRTAEIIWNSNAHVKCTTDDSDSDYNEPTVPRMDALDELREIDLYAFQGLYKNDTETIEKNFKESYRQWKQSPEQFEVSGHFPVIELWERGDRCWRDYIFPVLAKENVGSLLVVAHNAVNQSLLAFALELGPEFFRRILQSNCGVSKLEVSKSSSSSSSSENSNYLSLIKLNQTGDGKIPIKATEEKRYIVIVASDKKNSNEQMMNETMDEINSIHTLLANVTFTKIVSCKSREKSSSTINDEEECVLTKGLAAMFKQQQQQRQQQQKPKQHHVMSYMKLDADQSNESIQSLALESSGNVLVVASDIKACSQIVSSAFSVSLDVSERIKVRPGEGVTIIDVSKGYEKSCLNCVNFS